MNESEREEFGQEIRDMRGARGWTQAELAERAGVSKRTIGNLERGEVELQPGKLRAVLDALGYKRREQPWSREVDAFLQMAGYRLSTMPLEEQETRILAITKYLLGDSSAPLGRQ